MDKIFQKFCDVYPHYKLNTYFKKKIFYIIFSVLKFFLKGPFILNFKKFKFYAYPQKKNYSRSLLTKINLHDEGEINFLNNNIDEDSVFIDCGANQGFYSIPVSGHHPECKIYAFEPSKQEMFLLKENIKLNKFTNITLSEDAVADKDGVLIFKDDNLELNSTKGGFILDDDKIISSEKTTTINAITLDTFVKNLEIDKKKKILIKIDLEGYDFNAIYGSKNIINSYKSIILFEFSKMAIKNKVYNYEDFQNFCSDNQLLILDINLNIISLSDLHRKLEKLEKKFDVLGNFLIIKKENLNIIKS